MNDIEGSEWDENLDESTRVDVNHCRSSRMAFETGGPEIFIGFGF